MALPLQHRLHALPACGGVLHARGSNSSSMLGAPAAVSAGRRAAAARCRASSSTGDAVSTATSSELSVDIPTTDARTCIRFKAVPTGPAQQAIVVEAVTQGSAAAGAGVQRGMRLTAISDPVRRSEVWELQDRPSLRYIRDVLRMRSAATIELRFAAASPDLLNAMEAADNAMQLTTSSASDSEGGSRSSSSSGATTSGGWAPGSGGSSSSLVTLASMSLSSGDEESPPRGGSSSGTMAERLAQQFEAKQAASPGVSAFNQRQQRRKDYMDASGQGGNSAIVLVLGASFLLPALVILGVAWGSGYLDALYTNTMSSMR